MSTESTRISGLEQAVWNQLVSKGIEMSIFGLSEMIGEEVRAKSEITPTLIPVKDASMKLGGPETMTVAVYVRVEGAASGHLVLIYAPETAYGLVDMLLTQEPGTTTELGDLERSSLGEMGNIIGAFLLNTLADSTGLYLSPSPPAVMMDMLGSVLDAALAEILLESDDVMWADVVFGTHDRDINGTFLVIPSAELVSTVIRRGG